MPPILLHSRRPLNGFGLRDFGVSYRTHAISPHLVTGSDTTGRYIDRVFARDTSWNRLNLLAYILHVVAVGALAVAWVAIGLGLYSEPGADPRFELEAGGRFAANLMVYWPFLLVISPVLVVTGIFGLMPYRFAPGGTIAGGVVASLFAQWVGTELYLSDYKPALSGHLDTSIVAACFALAAAFAAAFLHLYGNRSGRTRAASMRGAAVLVVAILVSVVVTIPPLIAGSGTPSGVLAGLAPTPIAAGTCRTGPTRDRRPSTRAGRNSRIRRRMCPTTCSGSWSHCVTAQAASKLPRRPRSRSETSCHYGRVRREPK